VSANDNPTDAAAVAMTPVVICAVNVPLVIKEPANAVGVVRSVTGGVKAPYAVVVVAANPGQILICVPTPPIL
jgi:rRNA processing protein Gar1